MPRNATPKRPGADQERAIAVLASGGTITDAAKAAGVDRKTIYRWQAEDAVFVAALNAARDEVRDRMRADRDALASEAVATMRELMADGSPPAIRLRAAASVLDVFGRPDPPTVGPMEPEAVEALWERERREAEPFAWINAIPLERRSR